jgi:hypothetical protein
MDHPSS